MSDSKARDQDPSNPQKTPSRPLALRLRELEIRARPRRLQQTFTTGPGFALANTAGCDGCGVAVTRGTLEQLRAVTLGGRPVEVWLCPDCGQTARGGGDA